MQANAMPAVQYTVWPDDHFEAAVSAAGFEIDDVNRGPYVEVWARKGRR